MPHYSFRSPGGDAGKAIEDFFVQQALEQRRQMLADAEVKRQQEETRQRDEQLALTKRAQDLADTQRTDALSSLDKEREFRRASTVADTMLPGVVDPDTSTLLQSQGFGGLVQHVDVPGTPGVMDSAGGFKYQQARAGEQARAEQATQAQQAAAERAKADREAANERARQADETRRLIGTMNAQNQGATRALQNELTQTKIDDAKAKQEAAVKAGAEAESQIASHKNRIKALVGKLYDPATGQLTPDASRIFGPISAMLPNVTGGANTADADLNSLISALDINTLQQLKRQSKTGATGFGALSDRELGVLENAGTTLRNRRQGEPAIAAEFKRLLESVTDAAPGGGAGGAVAMVAPDGRPLNVPAEKVAELEALGAKRR